MAANDAAGVDANVASPDTPPFIATTTVFVTLPATKTITQPTLIRTPTTPLPTLLPTATSAPPGQPSATTIPTSVITEVLPPYLIHTGGLAHPNHEQITTLWVAAVMLFCILIGWNMVIIRSILHPWKMLTNLIHESSHVFSECCPLSDTLLHPEKVFCLSMQSPFSPVPMSTRALLTLTLQSHLLTLDAPPSELVSTRTKDPFLP